MPDPAIAGVVLSGGRSKRMGGAVKAHQLLGGKPLIRHVIDRLEPQVSQLVISVERCSDEFSIYGLRQVADPRPGSQGPLGGLLAALADLGPGFEWLVLSPCDAPFVPLDLAARLKHEAIRTGSQGAVVRYQSEAQPTFSIWNRSLSTELESAVLEQGMGGFKQFLEHQPLAFLDWETCEVSPFFNINDVSALAEAQRAFA